MNLLLVDLFEKDLYMYLSIALLIAFVVAIIIIYILINRSNKKFLKNISSYNEDHDYTFQFDFENDVIQIYRRAKSVEVCNFRFKDFREMIIKDQQSKYDDWINQLRNAKAGDNINASFAVKIEEVFGDNYRWLRFGLEHVRSVRGIVYCSAFTSTSYRRVKIGGEEIINLNMFKLRVEEIYASTKNEGVIYVVNCNMFDLIKRRYGLEIANNYLLQIIHTFHDLNDLKTLVGHYRNDTFLIYKEEQFKASQSEELKKYISLVCERIEFDKYQFNVKPTFGASILGKYSNSVGDAIEEAVKASTQYNGSVVLYDDIMFEEEQNNFRKLERVRGLLEKATFNTNFYPIVSLHNGKTFGVLSEHDVSLSHTLQNIDLDDEHNIELRKRFFEVSIRNALESFIDNDNTGGKRLFIFTDIDQLEILEKVYLSKIDYETVPLVAVINSYSQFLDNEIERSVFESLRNNKIQLGVVGEESMQTIYDPLLEFVSYVILPKKMIHTINIDQRTHMNIGNIVELMDNYGIQSIACDVQSIPQAEVLKGLGVIYMNGPLFDEGTRSGNVTRKLGKLLDEN